MNNIGKSEEKSEIPSSSEQQISNNSPKTQDEKATENIALNIFPQETAPQENIPPLDHNILPNEEIPDSFLSQISKRVTDAFASLRSFVTSYGSLIGVWYYDKTAVLEHVHENGLLLEDARNNLNDDQEVVFTAIRQNPQALKYASDRLKDDSEMIFASPMSWPFASEKLKRNKEVVLKMIEKIGEAYLYINEDLKNDKDVIFKALEKRGGMLEYIPNHLKNDKAIVLKAVKNDGSALQFASSSLRDDPEVVFEAIKNNGYALNIASNRLSEDPNLILEAIKQNGLVLLTLNNQLQKDPNFLIPAIKNVIFTNRLNHFLSKFKDLLDVDLCKKIAKQLGTHSGEGDVSMFIKALESINPEIAKAVLIEMSKPNQPPKSDRVDFKFK